MLLEISEVRKTYGANGTQIKALDGVSLAVDAGEFVAVQGPSGCGKTTLLLIAGGLLAPDSGHIVVAGEKPFTLPPNRRATFRGSTIGFVFQQFHLVPYLNVLENVMAAAISSRLPDAKKRARELLTDFGLDSRMRHVPAQLSTGERQRTALARALLNRPKLLLADEPTGNLDRQNTDVVLDRLVEFTNDGGAVLLVTHDETAASRANRATQIAHGKIASIPQTG